MSADAVAIAAFCASTALMAYNLAGYPWLLRWIEGRTDAAPDASTPSLNGPDLLVTIIVPVYNEERHILRKIENTLALRGPRHRIVFAFDGCTDNSVQIATAAIGHRDRAEIELRVHLANRGKVALLNEEVARADGDIVLLTDVSAMLPADALEKLMRHFADPTVGVVCPAYAAAEAASAEDAYWRLQTRLKRIEAQIAAPIGPHGACYLFRRSLWTPLPVDTINDDFVLPMRIVADGHRAIYDDRVVAQETERSTARVEFRRRLRLGAGNLQQVMRVARLASLTRPRLAFVFLSGKGLRAFIPLLAFLAAISAVWLAGRGVAPFGVIAGGMGLAAALGFAGEIGAERFMPRALTRPLRLLGYVTIWIAASALGSLMLLAGQAGGLWRTSNASKRIP